MRIYDFILERDLPEELKIFCEFSKQLKLKYKLFDLFGIDYSKQKILSIKLYQKFYTTNNLEQEEFFKWFCFGNNLKINQQEIHNKSLQGLNFAIKINLLSSSIKKTIYFSNGKNSSKVINFNDSSCTELLYRYFYNPPLIRLLNFYFQLNMPSHKEGIEFSKRGSQAHCSIFPKFNHNNMTLDKSKKYCSELKKHIKPEWPSFIKSFEGEDSSFITQGYTSNNKFDKTYFGCFDWSKSVF